MFNMRNSSRVAAGLALVLAVSACSKKDVVQDEPVMNPSDTSGVATGIESSSGSELMDNSGAGNVGVPAADMQVVFFPYDSYTLTSEARSALKANADWMKANPGSRVQVEGHCDERGTNEYNMALGDRRANSAISYLTKMGVDRSRLEPISYGEERPSDSGHDEAAWARNRRAVFVILSR